MPQGVQYAHAERRQPDEKDIGQHDARQLDGKRQLGTMPDKAWRQSLYDQGRAHQTQYRAAQQHERAIA